MIEYALFVGVCILVWWAGLIMGFYLHFRDFNDVRVK